ncbi:hypothetical protein FCULG_00009618 [Fusarium culmorum]|uniref:Uncharacterized protein n=1 Tax=Fusarium culmorum TaxID=5516 RepID=A0A2T4GHF1_FUSCU|nr:hypothetical protein FCULG_00009618 [Fusarium culmorum]
MHMSVSSTRHIHILPFAAAFGFELGNITSNKGGHSSLNAQIAERKYVHPFEGKARKHLDGPFPETPHRNELFHDFFVRGIMKHLGAQFSTAKLLCEPFDVLGFTLR